MENDTNICPLQLFGQNGKKNSETSLAQDKNDHFQLYIYTIFSCPNENNLNAHIIKRGSVCFDKQTNRKQMKYPQNPSAGEN